MQTEARSTYTLSDRARTIDYDLKVRPWMFTEEWIERYLKDCDAVGEQKKRFVGEEDLEGDSL
jgi:hypothetical protein